MQTEHAENHRERIIALLAREKLPTTDLPATLENFIVTKHHDEITGVVGMEIYGDFALLRSLVVSKGFRNQGLANRLLLHVESLAASKKLKAIYLLTETAADYFNRKGYAKITRTDVPTGVQQSSEFSHVCPQSAIVMRKALI